jgi:hypothetical protein
VPSSSGRPGTLDRLVAGALRRLRSVPRQSLGATIALQARSYERAVMVVRAYYVIGLVLLMYEMGNWVTLRGVDTIDPLWPAAWIDEASPQGAIDLVLVAFATTTLLAAVVPRSRLARAAFSLALLQYLAVKFGFGKINHGFPAWLFTSATFVLLPSARAWRRPTPALRRNVLQVVWSAQVVVLFTYTLTGLWKLWYAVDAALFSTRIGAFHPEGFALLVAQDLNITGRRTLLGEALVEHHWIGWLLFNGTIFLQVTSLLAALRPRLHRLWGAGLLAFHIGTQLAMAFTFTANMLLLGLLLLCSPWAPDHVRIRDAVTDLPGVRLATRTWHRVATAS